MDPRNIVLIGFMGTGKTSVGKALARRMGRELIDIDAQIEKKEGRRIREIFEKDGEAYFRSKESEVIEEASLRREVIITTGGGAVLDPLNVERLEKSGWILALRARPETIHQRVKDSQHRPLLNTGDRLAEIQRLLEARRPYYERCAATFDTDDRTSAQVADLIFAWLQTRTSAGEQAS